LLSCLADLSRDLQRTATAGEILGLLVRHARAAWEAPEAIAHWDPAGGPSVVVGHPGAAPDRHDLLALARHRGPVLLGDDLADECRRLGIPLRPDDPGGSWLLVPLLADRRPAGGLAIRGAPGAFSPADLVAAQAFAALATLALGRLRPDFAAEEQAWQEALDANAPALCVIDGLERIRRANRAFATLVGRDRDHVIGQPWRLIMPPTWIPDLDRVIGAGDSSRSTDLELEGSVYGVTAAQCGPAASDARQVAVLFADQTSRIRLQDQLVQAEKMSAIGQLIAGVAHDLNNPLASVVGFAEFLSERPDVPAALREPVTIIREEAERASGIVKNLLGFVRKQERQLRPTAIPPLLDATLALLRNELLATHVEAVLEGEPDLPTPVVDPNQIQQVFVNLIHNAIQAIAATGRPGTVTVRARRWRDGIALDIIDDGPGMPVDLAAQVFEPFFTTKPEGQGTGLGLSISQGIVTEHGGRITVESTEGLGSTFTVYLPAGEWHAPLTATGGPTPPAAGLRILVVDDEPHILHYMRATLESWGHTVAGAADGAEAKDRLASDRFDLVVADLRMPRLGGREFYEELHRDQPALAARVVFATGDTVRGDTLAFLKSVGRPYLHKPFSLTELRALLAGVSKAADA
jgi:two-component system NtrC family sensor kinase